MPSAERVESRSSSELSGLGSASASQPGTPSVASVLCCATGIQHSVAKLKLTHLDCFSAHLDCGNLFLHHHGIVNLLVDDLRLGISTVFCACWTSDAASQQARPPLNSGTALVEPPLSSELSGRSVPGVAS